MKQQEEASITAVLPQPVLGRTLGMCGLWGSSSAGWSVCRAWRDAMMQDPANVAQALLLRKAGLAPALRIATEHGHVAVVLVLLSGAPVDPGECNEAPPVDTVVTELGDSSLCLASKMGHVELVRALLSAGAQVDYPGEDGHSPLCLATDEGHVEVVRTLLSAGALALEEDGGHEALFGGCSCGNMELVRTLLAAGARVDPDTTQSDYTSPLWVASLEGHVQVVRALLSAGAQVDLVTHGFLDIDDLREDIRMYHTEFVDGMSALWAASWTCHLEVVRTLLAAGAAVDLATEVSTDITPLWIASWYNHLEVVRALLAAGAQIDLQDNGGVSPLWIAAHKVQLAVLDLVFSVGAAHDLVRKGLQRELE